MDIEDELDALYQRPLADFVARRNALAKRLSKAGDKEAAARIKALAKPSLTAWAVNQLAFAAPAELEALVQAGAAVRAAHLAAAPEQQAAAKARRDAISALLGKAEGVLSDAGTAMSRSHRQRISRTLEALSSRPPESDEPVAGRLARDLEPAGFDALADLAAALGQAQAKRPAKPSAPRPKAAPRKQTGDSAAAERRAERQSQRRAESEARRRAAARRALDRQLEEARQAITELEEKTAGLTSDAESAAEQLADAKTRRDALAQSALEAERAAREARASADEAGKSASRARFAAEAATAATKRASGELEALRDKLERLEKERRELGA